MSARSERARRAAAALALAVAVLAACGDDAVEDTGTGAGADADADAGDEADAGAGEVGSPSGDCPSDTAVSDAVGTAVVVDPSSGGDLGCHYYSDDGTVSVGVTVEEPATRTLDDIRRNLDVDDVAGIGDAAVVSVTPGGIAQLTVADGDRLVLVTVDGVDDPEAGAVATYALVG